MSSTTNDHIRTSADNPRETETLTAQLETGINVWPRTVCIIDTETKQETEIGKGKHFHHQHFNISDGIETKVIGTTDSHESYNTSYNTSPGIDLYTNPLIEKVFPSDIKSFGYTEPVLTGSKRLIQLFIRPSSDHNRNVPLSVRYEERSQIQGEKVETLSEKEQQQDIAPGGGTAVGSMFAGVKNAFSGDIAPGGGTAVGSMFAGVKNAFSGVRSVLKDKKQGLTHCEEEELGITEILTKSTRTHSTNDSETFWDFEIETIDFKKCGISDSRRNETENTGYKSGDNIDFLQRNDNIIDAIVINSKDLIRENKDLLVKKTTCYPSAETKQEDQDQISHQESNDSCESDVFLPVETTQTFSTNESKSDHNDNKTLIQKDDSSPDEGRKIDSCKKFTVDKEKFQDCNVSILENKENVDFAHHENVIDKKLSVTSDEKERTKGIRDSLSPVKEICTKVEIDINASPLGSNGLLPTLPENQDLIKQTKQLHLDQNPKLEVTPEAFPDHIRQVEWPKTGSAPSTPTPRGPGIGGIVRRGSRVCRTRRVSFPEDDSYLITSYLEPVNPWKKMAGVTTEEIAAAYRSSCERHRTRPLPHVLQQIMALPLGCSRRIECLSLRGQRLDYNQCEGLEEIFRRVQFKVLDFENCQLDDESAITLFDMIEFYDSSTQLNISCNSKISARGWQSCARMLKRSPSVEYLDARSTNLNEQSMPILGRALRLGTRLHTLHLENCNLTGRPMIMLAAALRQNDTLLELYLSDNRLGINDCIQLGNLARANTTLRIMDLRNNNVQDLGCQHICEGIVEQQKQQQVDLAEGNVSPDTIIKGLNTLVLWNNHLTGSCSLYVAPMLSTTTTLQTLNLGRNGLACSSVLRLKDSLIRNRALLRLGLQACKVGDEGAVALAEYTADNPVIQRIDLRENPIRVAGLMALALSMRVNTTVVQLDLDAEPRSEPAPELAEQHLIFHKEIKEYCGRNLTAQHLRSQGISDMQESQTLSCIEDEINSIDVPRKNSLTCGLAPITKLPLFEKQTQIIKEEEKQKYTSPEPSPLPSPSISPFNSPLVSPLKNRFMVSRVQESRTSSLVNANEVTVSYSHVIGSSNQTDITNLSSSVPAHTLHLRSLSVGDLGSSSCNKKVTSARPNRFSTGSRFTVTRVVEQSKVPLCSSLPTYKNSSPIKTPVKDTSSKTSKSITGPKIVISSPVNIERGFSIDGLPIPTKKTEHKGDKEPKNTPSLDSVEMVSNGSIGVVNKSNADDIPEPPVILTNRSARLESDGSSGSDDVFVDPPNSATSSHKIAKKDGTNSQAGNNQSTVSNLIVSDLTDSGYHDDNGGGRSPVLGTLRSEGSLRSHSPILCPGGSDSPVVPPLGGLALGVLHPISTCVSPNGSSSSPSVYDGDRDSLLSSSMDSSSQEDTGLGSSLDSTTMPTLTSSSTPNIPPSPNHTIQHSPIKRAPLAAIENGSFDTDSEESEITTQSSDSTHSDEVGITAEQLVSPRLAWADKTLPQTQPHPATVMHPGTV